MTSTNRGMSHICLVRTTLKGGGKAVLPLDRGQHNRRGEVLRDLLPVPVTSHGVAAKNTSRSVYTDRTESQAWVHT